MISYLQLKELEKQIKQKDEKHNKTNEKCKEVKIHFNFFFYIKCYLKYHFKVTNIVGDSSSKYLTFILQATKEVQEKAGEIKTLKSQIHSLTEQVSHLEANKSQVSTGKIQELSGSYKARL